MSDTFLSNPAYSNAADAAVTPSGHSQIFQNKQASVIAGGYLGVDSIESYDPGYCAQRCDSAWLGCVAFDIYFERDPTIDPGCFNASEATNDGQYCQLFKTVIARADGFGLNKCTSPSSTTTTTTSSVTSTSSAAATTSAPSSTTSSQISTTTTAAATSVAPSCSACISGPFTDGDNQNYNVFCDTIFYGNDIQQYAASCYQDCFGLCDSDWQCNAFSFDTTVIPISCWLKNIPVDQTGNTYPEQGVTHAQMPSSCQSCQAGSYTDNQGTSWTVSCDSNYWGSDFLEEQASCYQDCFELCDSASGCIAFTFAENTGTCRLKNPDIENGLTPYGDSGNIFAQQIPQSSWSPWMDCASWTSW